jgi:Ca2+-binding EF-hand superfamily protein
MDFQKLLTQQASSSSTSQLAPRATYEESIMDKVFKRAVLPAALLSVSVFMAGTVSAQQGPRPWTQEFNRLDTNKDGFLSRGELAPLQVSGSADVYSAGAPNRPRGEFRALDRNGDGYLSRSEARVLIGAHPGTTFNQLDLNDDGYLSLAEARPILREVDVEVGLSFAQLDRDNDGFLNREEARVLWQGQGRPVASAPPTVYTVPAGTPVQDAARFHAMDLNRDGRISRSEAADYFGTVAAARDFGRFDVDNDGFLSPAEADQMLRGRVAYR